jgi:hypothetical protein
MRKFLTGLFLLMCLHGWGQVDSLEFTTRRQVADTVFGLLNENIYGPSLIEKSITEDPLLINQLNGNYSDISHGWSWLQAYSDIALSYSDSTYMYSDTALLHRFENFHLDMRDTSGLDLLKQPFGLLLHHVSRIDTTFLNTPGVFFNDNCQLKLDENIDESSIYQKVVLKSAALLELDGEHGYDQGTIYYVEDFISTSPDITINSIQLNMGTGFSPFSAMNDQIKYSIQKDFQIGQAAIEYTLNGLIIFDTLSFYVSTKTYKYKNNEKSASDWDSPVRYFPQKKGADLEYCILYGCGNYDQKIRRPVIFAPPYRPISQMVSFNKYYNQFNFKSLLSSLSEMGYDVIFIKETPGNRGIDHAGSVLGDFIKFINEKKKEHFPNEDWENVVIGFSAGGQHWRYALKKLEKEHMDQNLPHHHTRLYIPFDSPHWGANVPMFTQAVYRDMYSFSLPALFSYESLLDAASKDMLMNHMIGSNLTEDDHVYTITPAPATEKLNVTNKLENWFNHQFTPMNDLRKSFPTFTRNVALSTGNNDANYNSEFGLFPGMKLFSQNVFAPAWYGGKAFNRSVYSSQTGTASQVFKREDLYLFLGIPLWFKRFYKTNNAYEWDLAQGGYKDEFYDEGAMNWNPAPLSGVPVGALNILVASAQNISLPFGPAWGTQHYQGHISFLPMVSALGINPSIWQNNNLYYNLKDEGLMYQKLTDIPNNKSDLYGYPNLGYPSNHFNITPFEALYCDPQTYEHIKMQASIDENNGMDDVFLVHTRNFILDEVEADIVYLQNKIIGKNHNQWYGTYRYKAWYKAYQDIVVGTNVTPKTDPGPYTIESTGEITLYACREINLKPGFSSAHGSSFHGFIQCDGCYRPHGKSELETSGSNSETGQNEEQSTLSQGMISETEREEELKVFPNPTADQFTIVFPKSEGDYVISDVNGRIFENGQVGEENKTRYLRLPKGVYYLKWVDGSRVITKKIMVL